MMKKISTIVTFILIAVAGWILLPRNGLINKVYKLIDENKTEEAIQLIEIADDVNAYSAPLFLRWAYNMVETDIKLPLVYACGKHNYEVVEALLKKGADPNKYLEGGWSPIEATLSTRNDNRLEIAKLLIEYGANVNLYGSESALFLEAMHLRSTDTEVEEAISMEVICLLLDNGASPISDDGYSILHLSATGNKVEMTRILIDKYGLNVNFTDPDGMTPLMLGAKDNAIDTVKLLIEKGADISIKDAAGKTAYDYAVEKGFTALAELLKP